MTVRSKPCLLEGVSWAEYRQVCQTFADRGLRITYDRGALEIMSPTASHDSDGRFLEMLIIAWHEVRGIDIAPFGSTTFRSRRLRRALEPDNCYYIAHEAVMRGVRRIASAIHPPPDLAVDVDVTRKSIRRLPIYRALGVPEVWRLTRGQLRCYVLQNGRYAMATESQQVPGLRPADLVPYLQAYLTESRFEVLKRFRAWCQAQP